MTDTHNNNAKNLPTVAIIGAGSAGLMCADYLKDFAINIHVFEQMPSAGRKFLMAGKTGLNLSHAEPLADFINRYTPSDWLAPFITQYNADWIRQWATSLGIDTYVGSSGRIFPVQMKGSPLLRAWLKDLHTHGVQFFYRHKCVDIHNNIATFHNQNLDKNQPTNTKFNQIASQTFSQPFDAIILACGGLSYPQLGSTGEWQNWLDDNAIAPFYASNVGICRMWSPFMQAVFGQALKRVNVWVDKKDEQNQGDIVISHYGFESGLIYKNNLALRQQLEQNGKMTLNVDLLPQFSHEKILQILNKNKKLSLNTLWKKVGLDPVKIALLRECTPKSDWHNHDKMASFIKHLAIDFDDFRPIDEAISCGGGVKQSHLQQHFQLTANPNIYCCGEMLDWDAPTGGYLLTACFATGRACGDLVAKNLNLTTKTHV